jgi:hypothetical protein
MYVVRKPFRNYGEVQLPGSIVEPGSIKWFKSRLKDRVIIEVNEHNFDKWREYFTGRYHVDITQNNNSDETQNDNSDETQNDNSDETQNETLKRVVVVTQVKQ